VVPGDVVFRYNVAALTADVRPMFFLPLIATAPGAMLLFRKWLGLPPAIAIMINFDEHEKREKKKLQEEQLYAIISAAEVENARWNNARELAVGLRDYLADKHPDVKLSVDDFSVSLARGERLLIIEAVDTWQYAMTRKGDPARKRKELPKGVLNWLIEPSHAVDWLLEVLAGNDFRSVGSKETMMNTVFDWLKTSMVSS
jgi:hypothetical protein